MGYPFDHENAKKILSKKRKTLGRGLSYVEKILFLHEPENGSDRRLIRGKDQIRLFPDRVLMQDATAQMAMLQFIQTAREKAAVNATIHCDHLLRADKGAEEDLETALATNKEVYDFLASAAAKYGIEFWGPGSGIMHQVIFENYAIPGSLMIGTDSHTPNAGGLGAVAIGVGGADAAEVLAGLSWEVLNPVIVGVRLTGSLTGWASAKDVIFEMLRRLTVKGGTGKVFEYYGPGAEILSATQKATITNMGAELGATSSVFIYDKSMDAYMRNVGRKNDADIAESFSDIFCQDPECLDHPERIFNEIIDIDLGDIVPAHSGPFSPDRVTKVKDFEECVIREQWPEHVSAVLLGSCTNSSYADLYAASQLLDQGTKHGLKTKIPLMLSPGSMRIFETIKRDGILDKLEAAGATVLTASCGPCIGQWDRKDVEKGVSNCLFTTFNRNFRGRNDANPETKVFLTSPLMAAVLALSGKSGFNPEKDSLEGADNNSFMLIPPCPPSLPESGLVPVDPPVNPFNSQTSQLEVVIAPASERLEFLKPFDEWDGNDFLDLPLLIKTSGKTTTDHISPGGEWLRFRGHLTNISRNLLDGAVNAFTGETGTATNAVNLEKGMKISELAEYYRDHVGGFVIVGDENYGEGSSREHAAMSPRFMGAKAIIARSFARIHETNLKKQGILPLTFSSFGDYGLIGEFDRISITGLKDLKPGNPLKVVVKRQGKNDVELICRHTYTREQITWFRSGSALNMLKKS